MEISRIRNYVDDKVKTILEATFKHPEYGGLSIGALPIRDGSIVKIWEKPILSGAYTIGFVDMQVAVRPCVLCIPDGWPRSSAISFDQELSREEVHMIEVKPEIRSLGEVIRQIRMYQTHCSGAKFHVCCPDSRFEKQLAAQKIGFIKAFA